MRHALVVFAAAASAAAIAIVAAVLVPQRGEREAARSRPVAVHASFSPSVVEFGDTVTARVVVTIDRRVVSPSSLRLVYGLAPLTQLARAVERRTTRGPLTVVTREIRAACLSADCIASSGRRAVTPAPVTVDAGRAHANAAWTPLTIAGRVTAADLSASRAPFRADTTPPPADFRVRPATLAALLDVVAVGVAACGAGLAAAAFIRRSPRDPEPTDELTRALRLARAARARPEPDRRAAAGYVARLLARRDEPLARTADDLAWSRPSPTPDALTDLVEGIERKERA
jgi:hypothetical protein